MKIEKVQKKHRMVFEQAEVEMVLRHFQQFEKLTKKVEQLEASGKMGPQVKVLWKDLKKFLESEELEGSDRGPATAAKSKSKSKSNQKEVDGYYCCCWYYNPGGGLYDCKTYHTWYAWAWAKCVAKAIAMHMDAHMESGSC